MELDLDTIQNLEIDYIEAAHRSPDLEERMGEYRGLNRIGDNNPEEEKNKKGSPYEVGLDKERLEENPLQKLMEELVGYIGQRGELIYIGVAVQPQSIGGQEGLQGILQGGFDSPELRDKFLEGQKRQGESLETLIQGDHTETPYGVRRNEYESLQRGLKRDTSRYFGNIGDRVGEGGMIFVDENNKITEQYGTSNDIAGAKILMDRYRQFVNETELGRELKEKIGDETQIDGYVFMEMGEGVRAAVMKYEVNGKERNVLGINKQYAQQLFSNAPYEITLDEADWYGHEKGHLEGLDEGKHGIVAEEKNDGKLARVYESIARNESLSPQTRQQAAYLSNAAEQRIASLPAIYSGQAGDPSLN